MIDDDPVHHVIMRYILAKVPTEIKTNYYFNAKLALNLLTELKDEPEDLPDIIFLDLDMSIMDGFNFLDRYEVLKPSIQKKIDIYILSSSTDIDERSRAEHYPSVKGYIVKPIIQQVVNEIIDTTLCKT